MLHVVGSAAGSSVTSSRGIGRRQFLSIGSSILGGIGLADLLRLQAQADQSGRKRPSTDKAVIVLWCHGGISHLETYDVKTRGNSLFAPLRTVSPDIQISALLPKHARIADKLTILRSLAHDQADHGWGTRRFLSGSGKELTTGDNGPSFYPTLECGINRSLGMLRGGLPVSVNAGGFAGSPWRGPGIWGSQYGVPEVHANSSGGVQGLQNMALRLPPERMNNRRGLLAELDRVRRDIDLSGQLHAMDVFNQQAWEVLISDSVRAAFDITQESPQVRARYGEGNENLLLARRLVEHGVNFVNVYIPGKPPGSELPSFNWDDHAVNWDIEKVMRVRLPWFDHIVSTLIEDIYERGLDKQVLVVVASEFGRTPRLDTNKPGVLGRDHYPRAMSVVVSGGGRARGNVIGATDSHGGEPIADRCDPQDFLASVYNYLGIDHRQVFTGLDNRPVPLTYGEPIAGLM